MVYSAFSSSAADLADPPDDRLEFAQRLIPEVPAGMPALEPQNPRRESAMKGFEQRAARHRTHCPVFVSSAIKLHASVASHARAFSGELRAASSRQRKDGEDEAPMTPT